MALFLRGNVWWMEYKNRKGDTVRESTKQKERQAAERIYNAVKVEEAFDVAPATPAEAVITVSDALERWLNGRRLEQARTIDEMSVKVEWWKERIGFMPLKKLTPLQVRDAIDAKREADGISNATSNRYLAIIRATLRAAHLDWGWLEQVPKLRTFSEKLHARDRYLSQKEVDELLGQCPEHLREMVAFSLVTGLRQGNVKAMRWEWVDFEGNTIMVPSSEYKNKRMHKIPMFDEAREILKRQVGKHPYYVFTYKGEPIKSSTANTAWKNALKRAQIEDFRWHDLRHTFASHQAQKGTPLQALQALGGWQSSAMVTRYAKFSPKSLERYGSNSVSV